MSAAAAVTTETTTTSTTAATLTWPSFIDLQRTTSEFLAVELIDRRSSFFLTGHFDKSKSLRLTCVAICNHARRFNCSRLGKQLLQILTGSLEGEVSDIKFF